MIGGERWRDPRGRALLGDVGLALGLTVLILIESLAGRTWYPAVFGPAALLMTLPLAARRRQPLLVFFLVVIGATIDVAATPYIGLTAVMVAAYSVGAYSRYRLASLGVMLATATAILIVFGGRLPPLPDFSGPYVVLVPLWLVGHALRTHQLRASVFEDRAARLEVGQEQATQAALTRERGRIARELHDVVAHSVSVMVVQAGAARHVLQTRPEQVQEALLAVEASGREAMAELRHLLGLLNDDGEEVPLAPQPGVAQLEALVQRVADAGLPVELRIEGRPHFLRPSIDLAAYRIVQEALTNALKYAGGAATQVVLQYREADLKVEILDEGTASPVQEDGGRGRGLVGMRERVALYGGRLEVGPRLERGYAVRAWLPLESS